MESSSSCCEIHTAFWNTGVLSAPMPVFYVGTFGCVFQLFCTHVASYNAAQASK